MEDWEVNVNWVDYPPGRVGSPHRHPGFTLAYVLQGSVVAKITGQEERTFKTGEMFMEPPGSVHEVSRNASQTEPARLLAINLAKKGLPPTTPA
jgi:quercetin dioxygenase-like cupin family protein